MRVLLAVDGSRPSDIARELVAGVRWPNGSTIRVITAVEYRLELEAAPWLVPTVAEALEYERPRVAAAQRLLDEAATSIGHDGIVVETEILRGRPATAIVTEADSFAADLVVVGSRGHSTLGSMVLGSTSAEVVDGAPCPVLVARTGRVTSVLFADDDSPSACHAREMVEAWPIFRAVPIVVLNVNEHHTPWLIGGWAEAELQLLESVEAAADRDRAERRKDVAATVASFRLAGLQAKGEVAEGDPAARVIGTAQQEGVDLVVVGSRGQTGPKRLVLGSVARNVLHHATASVLVVRQAARTTPVIRHVIGPAEDQRRDPVPVR